MTTAVHAIDAPPRTNRRRIEVTLEGAMLVQPSGCKHSSLRIAGDRIGNAALQPAASLDLSGHYIFPGLTNAHDHLHLNALPLTTGGAPFANSYRWAETVNEAMTSTGFQSVLSLPIAVRAWQGGLKNALSGITTVAHHDPWLPVFDCVDFPVCVVKRFGWCHSLGLGVAEGRRSPFRYGPAPEASFASTPPDWPWMIHLAEGADAEAQSELRELDARGCLAENTVLIHGIALGPDDVELVLARGASVVWCPTSNYNLIGATVEPRRLMEAGRLAIGSDSRLSGSQDLLEDIRAAANSLSLPPLDVFKQATQLGARILRIGNVGTLQVGACADLLIVEARSSDPYTELMCLRRADIRAVIRSGAPVIADPDLSVLFDYTETEAVRARLDGAPKLIARAALGPPGAASLEPGLEVCD